MRKARSGYAIAAAAALTCSVQAQEANTWDVEELVGRSEMTSSAQLSRQLVLAELRQAREEGTYHAGNEGVVPQHVLERRAVANQRQGERIARAYRDEAARIARAGRNEVDRGARRNLPAAMPIPAVNAEVTTAPVAPMAPVEPAVIIVPGQATTAEAAPAASDRSAASTAQPMPGDGGAPAPVPDVRSNQDIAVERRSPAAILNDGSDERSGNRPAGADGSPVR